MVDEMLEDQYNPVYDKIPTANIKESADKYQYLCMGLLKDKGLTL
jgi:hypothetical protein